MMTKTPTPSREAARARAKVAAGICRYCSKKAQRGYTACAPCRVRQNRFTREYMQRKRAFAALPKQARGGFAKRGKPQRCSLCDETGHNRLTCANGDETRAP